MQDELHRGIVRILKPAGQTAGTGFLVTPQLVVTCAHVIEFVEVKASSSVRLVLLHTGQELSAVVRAEYWRDSKREDIAVLQVAEPFHEGISLKLGTSTNISGHRFFAYGFPEGMPQEIIVTGSIIGEISNASLLQLASQEVTEGVSGAPVFDLSTRRVVGVITARAGLDLRDVERKIKGKKEILTIATGRLEETAFATPSHVLQRICPILKIEDICPYQGLLAFTEDDAHFFYGRNRLVDKLIESLRRNPRFLAVVGSSGSGKSSIVQAGLLARLRQNRVLGFQSYSIVQFRLSQIPRKSLLAALSTIYPDIQVSDIKAHDFWVTLGYYLQLYQHHLLVFIDQFEELFSLCKTEEQKDFTQGLLDLLHLSVPFTLVITIRADFYALLIDSALGELLEGEGHVDVRRMTDEELREAIVQPAEQVGLQIEAGLPDLIIRDLRNRDTANPLPLLEVTLERLWLVEHQNNRLTCDRYQSPEIGGVTGAITQWAEAAWRTLANNDERNLARQLLLSLLRVSISGEIPDTRRRLTVAELINRSFKPDAIRPLIKKLADNRLIVTDHDPQTGEETVEIIHEALFQEWQWFNQEIRKNRDVLLKIAKIETEAKEWLLRGKSHDKAYLLQGSKLAEAEEVLAQAKISNSYLSIASLVSQFVQVSQTARRNSWMKAGLSIVTFIVMVAGLGSYLWLRNGENYIQNLQPGSVADSRYLYAVNPFVSRSTTKALVSYRQSFLYVSLLQARVQSQELHLSKRDRQELDTLTALSEANFVELIRVERLPLLESELKDNRGTVWRKISAIASKRAERFEQGALRTTYRIIHDDGVAADFNKDGVIDGGESILIPCPVLEDIEKLWREYTGCGWYNTRNGDFFDDPECQSLQSGTRNITLTNAVFEDNFDFIIQRIKACSPSMKS